MAACGRQLCQDRLGMEFSQQLVALRFLMEKFCESDDERMANDRFEVEINRADAKIFPSVINGLQVQAVNIITPGRAPKRVTQWKCIATKSYSDVTTCDIRWQTSDTHGIEEVSLVRVSDKWRVIGVKTIEIE
jgi:hypothetical protein